MTNAPSHPILRTAILSVIIWSVGQIPTHLVALPTDDELEVCGYEDAKFMNLMLPVLPGDPRTEGKKKDIVFDLLISPEGELTASAPFYAPSKDFLPPMIRALRLCTYDPALECDLPASGFIRHTVTDYFYVTGSESGDDMLPPEPLWLLDPFLINQLDTIYRWSGEKEGIHIVFDIDAEGHISNLSGETKAAELLIEQIFEPGMERLTFSPATRSGEPIASQLTLRLSGKASSPYLSESQPLALKFEPMPGNPLGESQEEQIEVAATVNFDFKGEVDSARVDPGTPGNLATVVIAAVRAWTYHPVDPEGGKTTSSITCRFGFVPGEKEAFLLEDPQKVVWTLPAPTKQVAPEFPFELKKAGLSGRVEVLFTVDAKGKVRDAKVVNSSHPGFNQPSIAAVYAWRFKPGRRNNEKTAFRLMLPLAFNLNN